ncbi:Uncharacterised protein [Chlamydia trachomatis]|nr:Uncharacterised protein [Chlamydia trachomatis]
MIASIACVNASAPVNAVMSDGSPTVNSGSRIATSELKKTL